MILIINVLTLLSIKKLATNETFFVTLIKVISKRFYKLIYVPILFYFAFLFYIWNDENKTSIVIWNTFLHDRGKYFIFRPEQHLTYVNRSLYVYSFESHCIHYFYKQYNHLRYLILPYLFLVNWKSNNTLLPIY